VSECPWVKLLIVKFHSIATQNMHRSWPIASFACRPIRSLFTGADSPSVAPCRLSNFAGSIGDRGLSRPRPVGVRIGA
jgi:hypothetical protein